MTFGVDSPPPIAVRRACGADVRSGVLFRRGAPSPRRATRPTSSRHRCVAKIPYFGVRHHVLFVRGVRLPQRRGQGRRRRAAQGLPGYLKCVDEGDLLRDVLKSDTAAVTIPELDLELVHGTTLGRSTPL